MKSISGILIMITIVDLNRASRIVCRTDEVESLVCSQVCAQNEGRYTCSCLPGYVLADDNRTCLVTGEEPRLVYVSEMDVNVFYTETSDIEPLTELHDSHVTSIGFGPGASLLLVTNSGTVVRRTSLDGRNSRKPVSLIDTGLKFVTSVVVDWVTSNIYLVDNAAGTIVVCTGTGDNCSVIIKSLHRPYSATLDIKSKKLLWTEWGISDGAGSIRSADLAGYQQSLVLEGLNEPQNLVHDYTMEALFWVAKADVGYMIQCMKFDGDRRKLFVVSSGFTALSMSVLSDELYVANGNDLVVMNKVTGQVIGNKSLEAGFILVASIYHPVLYSIQDKEDPCASSPCSHLCVPSNGYHGYRCLCPVDMELDVEGKCTKHENMESLLVSGMTGIYEVPKLFIGNHDYRARRFLQADVSCVLYDGVEKRIYFYDDSAKAIQMIELKISPVASTLYKLIYPVEGMALNPGSRALYWTTTQGKVFAGMVDGPFSVEIVSGLHRPRGVTVDVKSGYVYICDWGSVPQIIRCHSDGTNCSTFIHNDRGHPNMIVIAAATPVTIATGSHEETRTLYWTDSKLDLIGYKNLDGYGEGHIFLNHTENPHPYSLVVTEDTIFFTDLNTRQVHYIEKADLVEVKDVKLSIGSLYGMDLVRKAYNVQQTPCSVDNGGCTHLCLVKPEGQRTCLCPNTEGNNTCKVERKVVPAEKVTETSLPGGSFSKSSTPVEKKDDLLLVVSLVSGIVILLVIVAVIVFCYHRHRQRKQTWMFRFIRYMKTKRTDDAEGLVSDSSLSMDDQNFKHFDDVDYPEDPCCQRRWDVCNERRETSMISTDSAFTEMKDFDTYSSIDNLSK